MTESAQFVSALTAIVGQEGVLTGDASKTFCEDWRGRYRGQAVAVAFPQNTEQVSALVRWCADSNIAIVPQGGNTSLCGASVPVDDGSPQLVINLSHMNRIRNVDAVNYTMTVEAGCKLAEIYTAADQVDRLFPLGLTAIAPHCEIGGNLSTNAGGIGVLRYGSARDLVLGLEVVLPDGRIWNGLRRLRKDNTGYDLKHLFMGAEGTLGIITAAVLKLYPRPRSMATACIAVRDPAVAVALLAHLRATCGDKITAFELISRSCLELVLRHIPSTQEPLSKPYEWYVLARLNEVMEVSLDAAMSDALAGMPEGLLAFEVTADAARAEQWWKLRKNIAEAQKIEGISIKHDISVPVSQVAEFIERAGATLRSKFPAIRIVAFGHMGDGNIHYNLSMPDVSTNKSFITRHEQEVNQLVYEIVAALDGSISAEHGLGQLKRETITHYKSALELELMRALKQSIDPEGRMNPGKLL